MKQHIGTIGLFILSAAMGHAALIPIGQVVLSGAGLGSVNTVLTFTSPGSSTTESGCVGAGSGGVTVTGSSKCPGAPFTGGNEQSINNVYSTTGLGLTDFNNLQLIFNASEPGGDSISLDNLALTVYSSTGALLQTHLLASPYFIANSATGVGNAGFGFRLDSTEAGQLNALLASNATLYLGAAANASMATGGQETISLRVNSAGSGGGSGGETPEPGTLLTLGSALLLGANYLRKQQKKLSHE